MQGNLPGIGAQQREFAGFDFERFLPALQPASTIEARHTVGMLDAITAADLHERVGDGLPETLEEVIQAYGHRYFKLKVGGQTAADLARLEAIAAVLDRSTRALLRFAGRQRAVFRCARASPNWWTGIRARPALARLWNSILFIEQPIARKLALDADLRAADLGKPVIIDESDGELDTFAQARERGYAGRFVQDLQGPLQVDPQRRALRAVERAGRRGALLHVGRRPDDAGRPVGAAGPGAGQPAGHPPCGAQRPPLRQRHGGAAGEAEQQAFLAGASRCV